MKAFFFQDNFLINLHEILLCSLADKLIRYLSYILYVDGISVLQIACKTEILLKTYHNITMYLHM